MLYKPNYINVVFSFSCVVVAGYISNGGGKQYNDITTNLDRLYCWMLNRQLYDCDIQDKFYILYTEVEVCWNSLRINALFLAHNIESSSVNVFYRT